MNCCKCKYSIKVWQIELVYALVIDCSKCIYPHDLAGVDLIFL